MLKLLYYISTLNQHIMEGDGFIVLTNRNIRKFKITSKHNIVNFNSQKLGKKDGQVLKLFNG